MNLFCDSNKFCKCCYSDWFYLCHGEKCNCLFKSNCFCVFCVFSRVSTRNELFVSKVGYRIFVKVIGFSCVFENGRKCNVSGRPCFFVVRLFFFQTVKKNLQHFVIIKVVRTDGRWRLFMFEIVSF